MFNVITVWENGHEDVCDEFNSYIAAHDFVRENTKTSFRDDELTYKFVIREATKV